MIQKFLLSIIYFLIGVYRRLISPFLGNNCRFHPSCSAYAREAFERHGLWGGGYLALRRFFACHPWSGKTRQDPVPMSANKNQYCHRKKD